MSDILCRLMLECQKERSILADRQSGRVSAWGLTSSMMDEFTLLHSSSPAAWIECGTHVTGPVGISEAEADSIETDIEPPDHVLVALAKFRLTGAVEAPKHLFE